MQLVYDGQKNVKCVVLIVCLVIAFSEGQETMYYKRTKEWFLFNIMASYRTSGGWCGGGCPITMHYVKIEKKPLNYYKRTKSIFVYIFGRAGRVYVCGVFEGGALLSLPALNRKP